MRAIERRNLNGLSFLLAEGEGVPIVLLHGIGSAAESFRPLMVALQTARPVFAWDMPGYGGSSPLSGDAPQEADYAHALLAALDGLGWRDFDLVGHSLGCVVAMAVAALAPARVRALMLASPALGYQTPLYAPLPAAIAERVDDLARLGPEAFAAKRAARLVYRAEANPDVLKAVTRAMAGVSNPGYAQASRLLAQADLIARAAAMICPVRIICGAEDVITPPANAQKLADAIQGATLTLIPECGHALPVEATAELARLILAMEPQEQVDSSLVPPVTRAVTLLRHIAAKKPVSNLSQAAREMGINRTTLHRLIHTLEVEGFIERIPGSDDYTLGTGLIELAAQKLFSMDVVEAASPIVQRLSVETGLSAHLGILQGREVTYLLRHAPNLHLVSNVRTGSRLPAHATTMGRILLAFRPWSEIQQLYGVGGLERVTMKTPVTLDQLKAQVEADRAMGLAVSQSNFEAGIDSVAAPIFDHSGQAIAAVNVSGPESAFRNRESISSAVRKAGSDISKRMGFVVRVPHHAGGSSASGGSVS